MSGDPSFAGHDWLAESVRSLLPRMTELGLATASEQDVDTLAGRIRADVTGRLGIVSLAPVIGAWTRLPAGPRAP